MSKFSALFKGVQANDAAIAGEMRESGASREAAESKLITSGRLVLNPAAKEAWLEHIELNPNQNHQAGFLDWAAGYAEDEDEKELTALQLQFPHVGDDLDALKEEKACRDLIEDICGLLQAKDQYGKGGKYGAFNVKAVRRQMIEGRWTRDKLIARRDEIIREQALTKKPMAELKQMVHAHYNQPVQFPGFPTLPEKMYERGQGWVDVDAAYLENLIRADIFSFKRLCRLYGSAQVDHRRGL